MAEIKLGNKIINLNFIKEGIQVDKQNKFLQKYDTDGNSIFSAQELMELQADLEKYSGDDKTLQTEEYLKFYAEKMQISLEEAKQKFMQYGNIVEKGILHVFSFNNDKIAKELGEIIDNNLQIASIDSEKFKKAFGQIDKNNIVDVLKSYKKNFKGVHFAVDIMNEKTASLENRVNAVRNLFNTLYSKIDKDKYSTLEIEKTFSEFLKNPTLKSEIEKLDNLFDTMIVMIEGVDSENNIDTELATNTAKNRIAEAKHTIDKKVNTQGGVSRSLDKLAGITGEITLEKANAIIEEHENDIAKLESKKGNYKDYCAEFERIFGVEYKPAAVANYNKLQKYYEIAKIEQNFLQKFSKELETEDIDRIYTHKGSDAAQKIYDDFYSRLCENFSKEYVDNYLKLANAEKMTPNNKYKLLQKFVVAQKDIIHKYTLEQCEGMDFSEVESARNSAYHAAYGTKKDSYLVAKDWVDSQNKRLSNTKIAFNVVAMAGAMFTGGGTLALVSSAALLTDPVGFTEQATDVDGMTKEDWSSFVKERAEALGWMALGMGAGAVGQAASKFVKLKGLSHVMKNGGKSLDDLLKTPNLPAETRAQLVKLKGAADLANISTEVLIDMTTTALLQKEGATAGDWIMSLSSSIAGTALAPRLVNMSQPNAVKALQETFPELKISKDEALKIIKNINDKVKNWAETPANKNNNRMNSSVIGVTPEGIENGVKKVARVVTKAVDSLLKNVNNINYLNNFELDALASYSQKRPKFAPAIKDGINEIAHRVSNGEYPSKEMKEEIIKGLIEKYPDLKSDKIQDELELFMERNLRNEGWRGIAQCMMYSEKWGLDEGYDKYILQPFKERKGWVEKSDAQKVDEPKLENTENKSKSIEENQKIDYNALMEKYPQVSETSFLGGIDSAKETMKFLEDYPSIMQKEGISFDNFHDMEFVIYQYIAKLDIPSGDYDRVFKLVKEHYHQDVIKNDARIKAVTQQFELSNRSQVEAGDKIIEAIRNKIKNGEKVDANYVREQLEELLPEANSLMYKKIEKYIDSFDDVKTYLDDCTHRNIYNNPDYTNLYQRETIDNCVKVLDWILNDVKNGKPLTKEMIEEYMNHGLVTTVEFGQEFLDEILSNHRILGPEYLKIRA